MKKDPVLDTLKKASKGLLFPSESDAPLEPFAWQSDTLTPAKVLALAKAAPDTPVEVTTLASLLGTVPSEDRKKFQALQKALGEQLSAIKVYKLGDEAEKAVYIAGKTADGRWAGLKTSVVET